MPQISMNENLVELVKDVHAMEEFSLQVLDGMIKQEKDTKVRSILEHHKDETTRHERSLREHLENNLGENPSKFKDYSQQLGGWAKNIMDSMRDDKAFRSARDSYAIESMEVASYELLGRLAQEAGDTELNRIAKKNLKDEQAMVRKIDQNWDRFVEHVIKEETKVSN